MDDQLDKLSKSLAEEVSRRETLKRLGKGLVGLAAGAILTMFGAGKAEASGCTTNAQCGKGYFCCYCKHSHPPVSHGCMTATPTNFNRCYLNLCSR